MGQRLFDSYWFDLGYGSVILHASLGSMLRKQAQFFFDTCPGSFRNVYENTFEFMRNHFSMCYL